MDVRVDVVHTLKVMHHYLALLCFIFLIPVYASNDIETKKTYIEDIFIWKMSDELKLTAQEEKKFSEIHKNLNKQKAELNKKIQDTTQQLSDNPILAKTLRKAIVEYNQLSLTEFDSMKKLLGAKRFTIYLQFKSELTNKVKSLLTGEKPSEKEKKEAPATPLPPPQVIIEKNE